MSLVRVGTAVRRAGLNTMGVVSGDYLRHSAFLTIRGGSCWGLIFLVAGFAQLLLLGYQRMLNTSGFIGMLRFFGLANTITLVSLYKRVEPSPSSYRPEQGATLPS